MITQMQEVQVVLDRIGIFADVSRRYLLVLKSYVQHKNNLQKPNIRQKRAIWKERITYVQNQLWQAIQLWKTFVIYELQNILPRLDLMLALNSFCTHPVKKIKIVSFSILPHAASAVVFTSIIFYSLFSQLANIKTLTRVKCWIYFRRKQVDLPLDV